MYSYYCQGKTQNAHDCEGACIGVTKLDQTVWARVEAILTEPDLIACELERLRAAGLLDFTAVSELSLEDIARRLASAGYTRGEYMNLLLARRVSSLATVLAPIELDRLKGFLSDGHTNEVSTVLQRVNGVGPVVLEQFWSLQNTD